MALFIVCGKSLVLLIYKLTNALFVCSLVYVCVLECYTSTHIIVCL